MKRQARSFQSEYRTIFGFFSESWEISRILLSLRTKMMNLYPYAHRTHFDDKIAPNVSGHSALTSLCVYLGSVLEQ